MRIIGSIDGSSEPQKSRAETKTGAADDLKATNTFITVTKDASTRVTNTSSSSNDEHHMLNGSHRMLLRQRGDGKILLVPET